LRALLKFKPHHNENGRIFPTASPVAPWQEPVETPVGDGQQSRRNRYFARNAADRLLRAAIRDQVGSTVKRLSRDGTIKKIGSSRASKWSLSD
jgi:hypothetical protein